MLVIADSLRGRTRLGRRFRLASLEDGDQSRLEARNRTAPAFYRTGAWSVTSLAQPHATPVLGANAATELGTNTETSDDPDGSGATNPITVLTNVSNTITPVTGIGVATTGFGISVSQSDNVSGMNGFGAPVNYGAGSTAGLSSAVIDPTTGFPMGRPCHR